MRIARVLTLVWAVTTLVILGWPAGKLPSIGIPGADKVAHFGIFLVGTFIALRGWPGRGLIVLVLLLVFAPLTELWQAVLPTGRSPEATDVVANILGIGAGWLLSAASRRPRRP